MGIPQMIITILGIFLFMLSTSCLLWVVLDDRSSNFNKACYLIGNTEGMNIYRKTEMIYGGLEVWRFELFTAALRRISR